MTVRIAGEVLEVAAGVVVFALLASAILIFTAAMMVASVRRQLRLRAGPLQI